MSRTTDEDAEELGLSSGDAMELESGAVGGANPIDEELGQAWGELQAVVKNLVDDNKKATYIIIIYIYIYQNII